MISLIGVDHLDLRGYERMYQALRWLRPDNISLETSPRDVKQLFQLFDAVDWEANIGTMTKAARKQFPYAREETLKEFVYNLSFKERAAYQYLKDHDKRGILATEVNDLELPFEQGAERSVELDLVRKPLDSALEDNEREYQSNPPLDKELIAFYEPRDRIAASLLKHLKGHTVHVCGLDHAYGDYHNLYEHLPGAQRYKLNEF